MFRSKLLYVSYTRSIVVKGLPRTKGSKTGRRHTPHPRIQLHKHEYVKTLEDFCECIFPRSSVDIDKILSAIKDGKLRYGRMQSAAEELGIDYNRFNAMLRRLKDLGILTRNYAFSEVFQNKITALSSFYARFAGKRNPVQEALQDANEYLKMKGYSGRFQPQFETENEEEMED